MHCLSFYKIVHVLQRLPCFNDEWAFLLSLVTWKMSTIVNSSRGANLLYLRTTASSKRPKWWKLRMWISHSKIKNAWKCLTKIGLLLIRSKVNNMTHFFTWQYSFMDLKTPLQHSSRWHHNAYHFHNENAETYNDENHDTIQQISSSAKAILELKKQTISESLRKSDRDAQILSIPCNRGD